VVDKAFIEWESAIPLVECHGHLVAIGWNKETVVAEMQKGARYVVKRDVILRPPQLSDEGTLSFEIEELYRDSSPKKI